VFFDACLKLPVCLADVNNRLTVDGTGTLDEINEVARLLPGQLVLRLAAEDGPDGELGLGDQLDTDGGGSPPQLIEAGAGEGDRQTDGLLQRRVSWGWEGSA